MRLKIFYVVEKVKININYNIFFKIVILWFQIIKKINVDNGNLVLKLCFKILGYS